MALAAAFALAVAACGSSESKSESSSSGAESGETGTTADASQKECKLGHFGFGSQNYVVQAEQRAMERVAKEQGCTVTEEDGNFEPQVQLRQLQDALTADKYNAWMIGPVDGSILTKVVEEGIEQGIKVSAYEFPIGPDPLNATTPQVEGSTIQVGEALVPYTKEEGKQTLAACERFSKHKPCRVLTIYGNPNVSPFDVKRKEIYEEFMSNEPEVELLDALTGEYEVTTSDAAVSDAISRYGKDGIDVIVCFGDQMCVGAEKAYENQGQKPPIMVGLGTTTNAIEGIKKGTWWSSLALLPETQGEIQAKSVIAAIEGKPIPYKPNPMHPMNDEAEFGPSYTQESVKEFPDFKGQWTVPGA